MFAARLCQFSCTPLARLSTARACLIIKPVSPGLRQQVRLYADNARQPLSRMARKKTLRETVMAPAGQTAFDMGKAAVAGASVFGLGALGYYGLGMSSEAGAIDRHMLWPQYVKERIKTTYLYFGGSILVTAASAVAVFRTPALLHFMMKNSWIAIGASLAAMIGTGMVVRSMPYTPGVGAKQMMWLVHCGVIGAVVAPMCILGGPLLARAAWYTAGIIGGLSTVAACAPSEKFMSWGGPLAIGLGGVFAASIGSMFLSPGTALGAGLYSISLYGGLIIFSGLLLYDTQRIIKMAEVYPLYGERPYDPINASISIYLDTINIFIRIATILSGGGGKRK